MEEFEYFPILRWKGGEQGAVKNLATDVRCAMLPVAELQQLEEGAKHPKLVKVLTACGASDMPIAVDATTAIRGPAPLRATARLIKVLRAAGLHAWPTIRGVDVLADPTGLALLRGQAAIVIRIAPYAMSLKDAIAIGTTCRATLGPTTGVYMVLDLGAIGELDTNASASILGTLARGVIGKCRPLQIAMAGGSFPMTLGGFRPGVKNYIPRKEMAIWRALTTEAGCADVKFGDYAVTNPEPLGEIDPRTMNPAAAIRYCLSDKWWLPRASGVRTDGKGGMAQYNDLCKLLVNHRDYCGQTFSFGDERYTYHAQAGATSGNFTTWRRDATNHHLTFTVRQLLASGSTDSEASAIPGL